MKKYTFTILLLLLTALICIGAAAEEMTSGGVKYVIDEGNNVTVTGYEGQPVDLVVPKYYGKNWATLTRIVPNAFAGCESLRSVTIEGGLMLVIDTGAFSDCVHLTQVSIPEYTQEIRENAFYRAGLTEFTVPRGMYAICANAFGACDDLRVVTFMDAALPSILDPDAFAWNRPNSERTIRCYQGSAVAAWAQEKGYTVEYLPTDTECTLSIQDNGTIWDYTGNMTNLVIPAEIDGIQVKGINNWGFSSETLLTSVTLPEGLTFIDNDVFWNCANLTCVNLPSTLTHLGSGAFGDCIKLQQIAVPEGVTVLEGSTFNNCSALESVTLPSTLNHIGPGEFKNCSSLKSIVIPEGITVIDDSTFENCTSLENVTLPGTLTRIGVSAFQQATGLRELVLPEGIETIDYYAFASTQQLTLTLPVSVNSIHYAAFRLAQGLTLRCHPGSYAAQWAKDYEIPFVYIGSDGTDEEFKLHINDQGVITHYTGVATDLVIPSEIDGIQVKAIGDRAFQDSALLTSVALPGTLRTIGTSAFSGCSALQRLIIPDGVTSIGDMAFAWGGLRLITIPDSVTNIADNAFDHCEELTIICSSGSPAQAYAMDHGIATQPPVDHSDDLLGDCGLYISREGVITGFTAMPTELVIPAEISGIQVTAIGDSVFQYVSALKSITLPEGLKTIGSKAFYSSGLEGDLVLPKGLESIGSRAFASCQLKHITIPDSVVSIGETPFDTSSTIIYCRKDSYAAQWAKANGATFFYINDDGTVNEYTLILSPNGYITGYTGTPVDVVVPHTINGVFISGVAANAFKDCTSLESIFLTDLSILEEHAFDGCVNLRKVAIPDNTLYSIGSYAFAGCTSLIDFAIPQGLHSIYEGAFRGAGLEHLLLPSGLQYIYANAFRDCPLESITFQSMYLPSLDTNSFWSGGVQTLPCTVFCYEGSDAEAWARNLGYPVSLLDTTGSYTLHINSDHVVTGYDGFIIDLVIPSEINGIPVIAIGPGAFANAGELRSLTIAEGVTNIGNGAFSGCYDLATIHLPDSLSHIGHYAFSSTGLTDVSLPNGIDSIEEGTFNDCVRLTHVTLPKGLNAICASAFHGCERLTDIILPKTVETIGSYAFYNTGLTKVIVPAGVRTLGNHVFAYCLNLEKITLHPSIESIGAYAFEYCFSLTNVSIPQSVTKLEEGVFKNCWGLKHVNLSHNLINLGDWAFAHCYSLNKVVLPQGLQTIGRHAFYWSGMDVNSRSQDTVSQEPAPGGLTSMVIPASVRDIGEAAFDGCPNLTISCYRGSYADQHAQAKGIPVIYVDECEHLEDLLPGIPSTCESVGLTDGKQCTICSLILVAQEELPMHSQALIIDPALAPTCTADGWTESIYCSDCGLYIVAYEIIPALGHKAEILPAVAPTCTTDGLTEGKHCANCGEIYIPQEIFPATGHQLVLSSADLTMTEGDALSLAAFAEGCEHLDTFLLTGEATNPHRLAIAENKLCALDTGYAALQLKASLPDGFSQEIAITAIIHAQKAITLPAALTEIGEEAFMDVGAEECILLEGVTGIGARAFADSHMKLITIPLSVSSIAEDAFDGCDVFFIAPSGSAAEAFAQQHGIPCRP